MTVATRRVVQKRRLVDDVSIKRQLVDEEKATPSFAIIPESSIDASPIASSSRQGAAVSKQSRGRRKQIGRASRFETRPMSMHDDLAGHGLGDVFRRRSEKRPVRDEWSFGQEEGLSGP